MCSQMMQTRSDLEARAERATCVAGRRRNPDYTRLVPTLSRKERDCERVNTPGAQAAAMLVTHHEHEKNTYLPCSLQQYAEGNQAERGFLYKSRLFMNVPSCNHTVMVKPQDTNEKMGAAGLLTTSKYILGRPRPKYPTGKVNGVRAGRSATDEELHENCSVRSACDEGPHITGRMTME